MGAKGVGFRGSFGADLCLNQGKGRVGMKHLWLRFWKEEDGSAVIEIVLVLVVLIAGVLIFKEQILKLVENIFDKIVKQSNKV